MRLKSTIAVAALLSAAMSSAAFAKDCGARPAKLAIPDGATASDEAMKATQAKLTPYANAVRTYLTCLTDEVKIGKEEYDSVSAEWKRQSDIFQKTPAKQ